ncbi:MAG TPA: hypothetical protein H9841_11535 [Candidatus Flavonifractor merdigallinarum]|uniref:Copper amine oxidase-like N-terminal domain-containing protein n=1 Tax=Candidatus Flavonifractor merdigallinarum TaxID=2838589 RepID=A0A9D2BZM7_9FIRM|nr:hypothetical protein [Candidatus Flavonifractor merdigallinarum]
MKMRKKILAGVLTGTILLSAMPMALAADTDASNAQDFANISPAMVHLDGETYYRLRDVAALVSGTARKFDVLWNNGVSIQTGTAYRGAVPYDAPTNGTAQELDLKVDGKSVTTPVVLAGSNYYVTKDFLATLGIQL